MNQAIVSLVIIDNSDQVKREKSAVAPSFIEVSNIVETHTQFYQVNRSSPLPGQATIREGEEIKTELKRKCWTELAKSADTGGESGPTTLLLDLSTPQEDLNNIRETNKRILIEVNALLELFLGWRGCPYNLFGLFLEKGKNW